MPQLLTREHRRGLPSRDLGDPILAEIFSVERLEQHARSLATAQSVTDSPHRGRSVVPRTNDNGRVLENSYRLLAQAIREERVITPAAEWLVDNFPIVDEQLREIRDDLPTSYYRILPKLASGHLAGFPRVIGLAWAYVAHTDSRFEPETLRRMVRAYQEVQPLTLGELWAVAISLRVLLVENLRRLAEQIVSGRDARQKADQMADDLLDRSTGASRAAALRRLTHAELPAAGRVQLFQRLRDLDPSSSVALSWMEDLLHEEGTTADEMVRLEHQHQATMTVTVRNVITSMRLISWFDWAEFVESVSLVDEVFRNRSEFGAMDFATRNRYRGAVEELARHSGRDEVDVARIASDLAAAPPPDEATPADARQRDPGYYLISDGRATLERTLEVRVALIGRLRRLSLRSPGISYMATVTLMTIGIVLVPLAASWGFDILTPGTMLVAALALVPASDLAVAMTNRAVTRLLGPRTLPRLELPDGVPAGCRTLVVVPMMLTAQPEIADRVAGLEVHYLANRDGDIRFALLSDWLDAPAATMDGDDELVAAARAGVERLNERHGEAPGGGARFLLLHRPRTWNESERCWMGWERKRGKLHELNALLQGSATTGFVDDGRPSSTPPAGVRYVVTLDADTRLPLGAVRRLVATIAHPLNQPHLDPVAGRVTRGYGVLQPRITPTLPVGRKPSLFSRIHSGPAGIDPYASAVSDVYQDLFKEGSFTGKGLYDLAAFSAALADRVPENTLLSHDLFEGVFARVALVTDVELFDDFPSNYLTSAARHHRWARGDWQLLPWILGRGRDTSGRRVHVGIPAIARWKMIDNLRRTLSAPFALATVAVAWTLHPVSAASWMLLVAASITIPAVLPVVAGLRPRRTDISRRSHLRAVVTDVGLAASHITLAITFLAYQAWLMLDAISRTLVRLYLTHRNMLEWTTAAEAQARCERTLVDFHRRMMGGLLLALAAGATVVTVHPRSAWVAVPLTGLWCLAPTVAHRISRLPGVRASAQLTPVETRTLRLVARRTWLFFETFMTAEDHALPPDNFQDDPVPRVEHRTSPTNIGVAMLATVAARDFGWIGTIEMVERLEATMDTIHRLERFRGHLYNWYDTRTLSRLDPAYVSSVDSGNLAGHLLVVANACRQIVDQPLPASDALEGMRDALELTRAGARPGRLGRRSQTFTRQHLDDAIESAAATLGGVPAAPTPARWAAALAELGACAATLADTAAVLAADDTEQGTELVTWATALRSAVHSHELDNALMAEPTAEQTAASAWPTLAALADPADRLPDDRSRAAATLVRRLQTLADDAQRVFTEMDFHFLFDPMRKLLSIGYRELDGTLDPSYYDLLASEARLASFLAIAKGDVEPDHWFRLGRALTPVGGGSALVSWSGSMFEYLMPALVMRAPTDSLLHHTAGLVVARQIRYGAELGVPWGVSESGFNARDLQLVYQYSSFGVPGLGLKRGLSENQVIAPYATALAAMVQPKAAVKNFARLEAEGAAGRYGFREALDYTARRVPEGASVAVVQSYMAHHQGMALVAIGNVIHDNRMVDRFHSDPVVEATELLLQERMPRDALVARPRAEEVKTAADVRDIVPPMVRRFTSADDPIPRTHVLSNGRYAVMLTTAGSGYSKWGDLAVTRWREDATLDQWGTFLFLRDVRSDAVWSACRQPIDSEADSYDVTYAEDRAEYSRRDGSILTRTTVLVSGEHDAEIRRVSLTNLGQQRRTIELTSYAEIALATPAADAAHPAFQNLFVQTEWEPSIGALLATRRLRSRDEAPIWAAHVAAAENATPGHFQYETDRARFVGRGRSVHSPVSVMDGLPLSNTVGAVLDPIFSIRITVDLPAGATTHVNFSTVVAESRDQVVNLADKYRDANSFERAGVLAWTQAQVQLHHLGVAHDEAHLFQRLGNRVIYSDPSLRPAPQLLAANRRGVHNLWAHGISGDLPIVLVRIDESDDIDIVRQLLRAHQYWRIKLLDVDLVILNEHGPTYAQGLHDALLTLVRTSRSFAADDHRRLHGDVYVLRGDQLSADDRLLLQCAARAVLVSHRGSLADQVVRRNRPTPLVTRSSPPPVLHRTAAPPAVRTPELEFFNGLGGFAADGREYVIVVGPGQSTPAPWLNVIANETFGFQVSESGAGYTWCDNSRENQLTPWSNDSVTDPAGEAIYVRDDDSGEIWGPTALPARCADSVYVTRHGNGYTRFEHEHDGIRLELVQFVAGDEPLKCSMLTIENRSGRTRRLSVTAYVEWVLGTSRGASAHRMITSLEPDTNALLARNPWNNEFTEKVAFLDMCGRQNAWTSDRTEFLGRNGRRDRPLGLALRHRLSGAVGGEHDPCGALQTTVELATGSTTRIDVLLGEADNEAAATALIRRGRAMDRAAMFLDVVRRWEDIEATVQVHTPNRSMDIMLNGWLPYQTVACRMWARAAFYQAGGAFGFRDQLQDALALLVLRPDVARAQLLRAAAHQFVEGDVQHWWHPPADWGVRTRISDDRVWLPYTVDRYVSVTGDTAVLDEMVPYLRGLTLLPDQTDAYFRPDRASELGSLYDHCAAALDHSLAVGTHGLPLIGSGDWNDGMNRVGHEGKGESVWLGWFLHATLAAFAPVADARGDHEHADRWRTHMAALAEAIERDGWDGDWYRRAYFDDGTPLGSAANDECRIDSIAQSWAVLSHATDPGRAERAMAAVDRHLVNRADGLVLLFTPPFDRSDVDPGYIKGYLPGIRENGGQYTHAAIWSLIAFAQLGDGDKATELFSMLNPINRTATGAGVHRYKVEPYVMPADVSAVAPHVGRGGWTWYTGSAGWMYQAGVEWILGFRLRGTTLQIDPCIPSAWRGYEMTYLYRTARYEIVVENPHGVCRGVRTVEVDGRVIDGVVVALVDDGTTHRVRVVLGSGDDAFTG